MTALVQPIARLYQFRELLLQLVSRDLKVRYKRSALGMLWSLVNPMLQMLVYTFVFATIMKVNIPAYPIFLLSGLLPWTLIASSTSSAHSLLNNQGLIKKVAVPQAVYPLSVVGSKLVDVGLSLIPLALIAVFIGRPPTLIWLMAIFGMLLTTIFTVGLSLLFSSLMVLLPKFIAGFSGVAVDTFGYVAFFNATALLGAPVLILVWLAARVHDKSK